MTIVTTKGWKKSFVDFFKSPHQSSVNKIPKKKWLIIVWNWLLLPLAHWHHGHENFQVSVFLRTLKIPFTYNICAKNSSINMKSTAKSLKTANIWSKIFWGYIGSLKIYWEYQNISLYEFWNQINRLIAAHSESL